MSTAQATLSSSWKQEVNRRVAEHRNRNGAATIELDARSNPHRTSSHRAAEAAARVAARFANAPSYSEVLAEEARAAVRAAEFVSRAALHAQAAAESVLAGLEAASMAEASRELPALPAAEEIGSGAYVYEGTASPVPPSQQDNMWALAPAASVSEAEPPSIRAVHSSSFHELQAAEPPIDWAQPLHANLIEFPRELVATRKVRPRLVEGPYAELREPSAQLSIFEVDPGVVSTQPIAAAPSAPAFIQPEWSGIELDAQPVEDLAEQLPEPAVQRAASGPALELASLSRRLLAVVVDGALMVAALAAAAMAAAANAKSLPGTRQLEMGAAATLLVIAVLYQTLFFTLANATPGMRYARIRLSTFANRSPTRAQRTSRLVALLLSVLPVGLGLVWAVFDEDRLSWHDRLSETYLRKC